MNSSISWWQKQRLMYNFHVLARSPLLETSSPRLSDPGPDEGRGPSWSFPPGVPLRIRTSFLHWTKAQRNSYRAEQAAAFIEKKAQLNRSPATLSPGAWATANLFPSEQNLLPAPRGLCSPSKSCCFTPGKHLEPSLGSIGLVSPPFTDQVMKA